MEQIEKEKVFRIAKEYAENKYEKDSLDFTDEEEAHYLGYIAGLLKGLRMGGVEILDL